jgi:hypothetical protein
MEEELLNHLKGLKKEDGTPIYDFEKDSIIANAVAKHKEVKTLYTTEKEQTSKELAELKSKLTTFSEKNADNSENKDSENSEKVATKSKVGKDAEKSATYLTLNDLERLLEEKLTPVLESVKALSTESVAEYKRRLISENSELIIPEMILGNTKKDIDASLTTAKAAYTKYVLPNKKAEKEAPKTPQKEVVNSIPAIPIGGGNSSGNEIDAATISKMSIKEFAEHREKLKAFARLSK